MSGSERVVVLSETSEGQPSLPSGESLQGWWHLWAWDLYALVYSQGRHGAFGNQVFAEREDELMTLLRQHFGEGVRVEGLELLRSREPRALE